MKRWQTIYKYIKELPVSGVLEYTEIEQMLALPIDKARPSVYKAIRELEAQDSRTMENVQGVGYRVVHANEHERLVRGDVYAMKRRANRALRKTIYVRREDLDREQQTRLDDMQLHLMKTDDMLNRINERKQRRAPSEQALHREMKEVSAIMSDRLEKLQHQIDSLAPKPLVG